MNAKWVKNTVWHVTCGVHYNCCFSHRRGCKASNVWQWLEREGEGEAGERERGGGGGEMRERKGERERESEQVVM